MRFYKSALCLLLSLLPLYAKAGSFEYDYSGHLRTVSGYAHPAQKYRSGQNRYHTPTVGEIGNVLTYNFNEQTALMLSTKLHAITGTNLDNLNQGKWGEEVYGQLQSAYGDFYFGQMPNSAVALGVNRPNFSTWQIKNSEIVNFINNPNWQQKNHTKFYNTLDSTLINTDGSSLKASYLTPEFLGTTFGATYIPENNANDGLSSKFSPYYKKSAYILTLYNHQAFEFAETDFYLSYADYHKSHQEYATGASIYRKGWTLFAAYRQTEVSGSDYPLSKQSAGTNTPAYYDGFRQGKAFNAGVGYEWAIFNSTLNYFESSADDNSAKNKIINLHNSIKPWKHAGFYWGVAWVDFKTNYDNLSQGNKGTLGYLGLELSF